MSDKKKLPVSEEEIGRMKSEAVGIAGDKTQAIRFEELVARISEATGIGKRAVKNEIKALFLEVEKKRREEEMNTPKKMGDYYIPAGYDLQNGLIVQETRDGYAIICDYFVIEEILRTSDNKDALFVFFFIAKNLRVEITGEEFVDPKRLELTLLNHGLYVGGDSLRRFKSYVTSFINTNQEFIKVTVLTASTGWQDVTLPHTDADGRVVFRRKRIYGSPTVTPELSYVDSIESTIERSGDLADSLEVLNESLKWKGPAVAVLSGLAATLIYPLRKEGMTNFVVNFAGTTGAGKTLSAKIGLSMFGNASTGEKSLVGNMNATAVGGELKNNTYRDMPVLMDEMGTAQGSPEKKAQKVLDVVFQYTSGQGRTRANRALSLRDEMTSRGVLFLTMESNLQTIARIAKTAEKGYFRRTIEVFTDGGDYMPPRDIFDFTVIEGTYGYIAPLFIEAIAENYDEIREDYKRWEKELSDSASSMRGKEKYFAALYAALEHLKRLELITPLAYEKAQRHLQRVYLENLEIMEEVTEKVDTKWINMLIDFVEINRGRFATEEMDVTIGERFGEIVRGKNGKMELRIIPKILEERFLDAEAINDRAFKELMKKRGLITHEKNGERLRYTIKRGTGRMYVFDYDSLLEFEDEKSFELIVENAAKEYEVRDDGNVLEVLDRRFDLDDPKTGEALLKAIREVEDPVRRRVVLAEVEEKARGWTVERDKNGEPVRIEPVPF